MLLEVKDLCKSYRSGFFGSSITNAVDHVNFSVEEGEILGLFGESGCGKTTVSRMIMGLIPSNSGEILFNGTDLTKLKKKEWKAIRREVQMVYQHPQMTFNPRSTVYQACAEPLEIYNLASTKEEKDLIIHNMLDSVGVSDDQLKKYPHEISGGQAQRISFARTLVLKPKLLIMDEPTSMLDISVQAQIMEMIRKINREQRLTMLFISHDLDVVHSLCNKVAVMKAGKIVEYGKTEEIFANPQAEYTKQLLNARM